MSDMVFNKDSEASDANDLKASCIGRYPVHRQMLPSKICSISFIDALGFFSKKLWKIMKYKSKGKLNRTIHSLMYLVFYIEKNNACMIIWLFWLWCAIKKSAPNETSFNLIKFYYLILSFEPDTTRFFRYRQCLHLHFPYICQSKTTLPPFRKY